MSSLLVLLALLSVATLAARPSRFDEIVGAAATPVLVGFGVAVGPDGLAFVEPSLVKGLQPALSVAVCWLGLIAGLRAAAPIAHEPPDRRALLPLLDALLAGAALYLSGLWAADPMALVVAALIAGACLGAPASTGSDARIAKVVALLLASAAVGLASPVRLGMLVGIGAGTALVVLLAGAQSGNVVLVAVLGAVALAAGVSGIAGAPGVLAGVTGGAILARTRAGRALWPIAERSERPLRIVVTVLVAASAHIDPPAALLGLGLAALALGAGALTLGPKLAARSGSLAASSLALALIASLAAAGVSPALLAPLLVAIAIVDAVALAARIATRWRKGDAP